MRKTVIFALSALMLLGLGACRHYETVSGDPLQTKIYTLDNGLKIYMSVNKEQPRLQTYIAVRVGGKNDPSETTGLAHYFEHLMFKGTEQFGTVDYAAEKPMLDEIEQLFEQYRKTEGDEARAALYHKIDSVSYEASKLAIPNEYDKLMAMIGAEGTNAWTSYDETVYTEDIPSNQIDNWARIQADRFRHNVIRGFHTELETVYEEKNMSLTRDSRKVSETLLAALFPHHPYGNQTVLGTQEHLKNPSITNIKKYHDQYYVPNNIAICVSGDFNPDRFVKTIEKYFGDWKPNPDIPQLHFEEEAPLTAPIEREVYGLESENLMIAWPLPAARDLQSAAIAEVASAILSNNQAGLMDIDIAQQQKALAVGAGVNAFADHGLFLAMGYPKEGQSLEEVRDLILGEVAKLRQGDFDPALIEATVNNIRLMKMRLLEENESRAQLYVNAFINGVSWADAAKDLERYAAVTRDDIIAWAEKYLSENGYAVVYKRVGEDTSVQKIQAPSITPIVMNRDLQSDFLAEIQQTPVKPIEPVFVDFKKDMSVLPLTSGSDILYKHNDLNDIFSLDFICNTGDEEDPALEIALSYLPYLGTEEMTAEQIATRMYSLACSFNYSTSTHSSTISVSGLSENMAEALELLEDLVDGAVPNDEILNNLKMDVLRSRMMSKSNQSSCFSALQRYVLYGPEYIARTTLSDAQILALTSEDLMAKIEPLRSIAPEILYYGPMSEKEVKSVLEDCDLFEEDAKPLPERYTDIRKTGDPKIYLAQYDAKQLYYLQLSNRGETFDPSADTDISLYNEYFGGGMNGIVFQEMRESRGLAYSAQARLSAPAWKDGNYYFMAFIATQNDKMQAAVEAFDEIINNMPLSDAAYSVAVDGIESRIRTQRLTGASVLNAYRSCRRLGISEPMTRQLFKELRTRSLEDVQATQQKWVKDRNYTYAILGDINDIDTDYLKTIAPVEVVSLEQIFGY
ncbi:MAG: insulinase family protein [Bacteroidales bacterium]|nr:insulinase family protein [Bacteroidales bacterium]